ncbi:MAG: hypothetical protein JXA11_15045 [Phycisphaerae bacterium]|nr:hypothetical protein [Phycisphaerae bacterium]
MLVRTLLIVPLLLLACGIGAAMFVVREHNVSHREQQLVLGTIGEPDSLNPILSQTISASEVEAFLFNALIGSDEHQNLEGAVAETFQLTQRSTAFCHTPADAEKTLTILQAAREQWKDMKLASCRQDGRMLLFEFVDPNGQDAAGTGYETKLFQIVNRSAFLPVSILTIVHDESKTLPGGTKADTKGVKQALRALATERKDVFVHEAFPINDSMLSVSLFGNVEGFHKAVVERFGAKDAAVVEIMDTLDEALLNEPIITFKLRKDVRWHDGAPLTAADAEFTYRSIVDPQYRSPRASSYWLVKDVKTVDPYTLIVTYRKPYVDCLNSWSAMALIPKHILAGKSPQWWADHYNSKPVGSGPFRFAEWKRNEFVRLVANSDYYEGAPNLPAVVYRVIPDSFVNEIAFQEHGFDTTQLMFHQVKRYEAQQDRFQLFRRWARGYLYIGWNMKKPMFRDVRVRRALAHAVDTNRIIRYVYYGWARPSTGPIPDVYWFSNKDIKPIPFDPERAKALLAEAGWADTDGDGILDKNGQPFEFTLITNHGNPMRALIQMLVQDDLRQLGIKVNTAVYEWAVFINTYINTQQFDACILGWFIPRNLDRYQLWNSSQIEPPGLNFCSYSNPEVDKITEEIRTTFEKDRLAELSRRIEEIIYRDQPYLFLLEGKPSFALYRDMYVVRRPDEDHPGTWITEPIRNTKAGLNGYDFYMPWWAPAAMMPQRTP